MIEEQQKSNTGIIITIIIVGIIIIGAISLIVLGVQRGWFKSKTPIEPMKDSKVLIDIQDYITGEKISSDYTIKMIGFEKSGNHQSGVLSEETVPSNHTTYVWACSNSEDYYSGLDVQDLDIDDKKLFKVKCLKIDKNPEISHIGELQDGDNSIILNISIKEHLRNLFMCLDWSNSITKIEFDRKTDKCDGNWTNCSYYETLKNGIVQCAEFYPASYYKCESEERMTQCSEVDGFDCSLPKMLIPTYLKDKARKCFRMDEDFLNEEKNYVINYRAWNIWFNDCITVYVGDSDNDLSNNYVYEKRVNGVIVFLGKLLFEKDSRDIKMPTVEYKICKNG